MGEHVKKWLRDEKLYRRESKERVRPAWVVGLNQDNYSACAGSTPKEYAAQLSTQPQVTDLQKSTGHGAFGDNAVFLGSNMAFVDTLKRIVEL